jgi:hypothetical protein
MCINRLGSPYLPVGTNGSVKLKVVPLLNELICYSETNSVLEWMDINN